MRTATVTEPALLIRIAQTFDPKMSRAQFYEATRGVWRLGNRREAVRFALAVADGTVREVFEVREWHPAGSTPYQTRQRRQVAIKGRWEFTGVVAEERIRDKYIEASVAHYFALGNSNPILYVNA